MSNDLLEVFAATTPTAEDAQMADAARRLIMESIDRSNATQITVISDDESTPPISVPPHALKLFSRILDLMAKRQTIVLIHQQQEFSTVEAANFLNVSRPFVIKEIEAGRLKHRKVGTHRRVLYEDLIEYEKQLRAKQQDALERMAENAREMGLTY